MRIVPVAGLGVLFAAFLGLGFWQLDRAADKRALFDQFNAGGTAPVTRITDASLPQDRYRRLTLSGRYLSSRQVLLDSMTHAGRVGYQVLTPFKPENGDAWLVVNRGWLPASVGADSPPDVDVEETRRTIAGRIDALPRPGLRLDGRAAATEGRWPRVMLFPTLAEIEDELGLGLTGFQLLLDPDQADGFERAWQPRSIPPERHVGYAVQWFGLAGVLAIFSLLLVVRAARSSRVTGGASQ